MLYVFGDHVGRRVHECRCSRAVAVLGTFLVPGFQHEIKHGNLFSAHTFLGVSLILNYLYRTDRPTYAISMLSADLTDE